MSQKEAFSFIVLDKMGRAISALSTADLALEVAARFNASEVQHYRECAPYRVVERTIIDRPVEP